MKYLKKSLIILALVVLTLSSAACGMFEDSTHQFKLAAVIPDEVDLKTMAPQAVTLEADEDGKANLLIEVSSIAGYNVSVALAVKSIEGSATSGNLIIPESDKAHGSTPYSAANNANLEVQLVPGAYYLTVNGERAPVDVTVVKHGSKPAAEAAS